MLALGLTAGKWLIGNWRTALPILAVIAVGLWGGWQYLGKVEAQNALADQKLQILEDANATWGELARKQREFQDEVRQGFKTLTAETERLRADNAAFQAGVRANANSKRPLDPVERAALGMLAKPGGDQAGGGAVRPPAEPPPVR